VSGLTASGLTLTDNGTDTLTVPAGAATFTFSQALQSGATYAVAIATQPSNEQCTVSSASGTVSGNVSGVAVVCTQLDTIGGAVSGLSAAGLVLELNGQYSLTVPANASSYVFTQGLASGTAYQITIATQPNDESCAVSPSAGTVSGNVTNANVTCSTTAYSISGTISGLSASGLQLQFYSSGPQLSVAAGATTFTYGNVPYGTDVAMDVVTQPYWQWCTPGSSDYSGPITSNITGQTLSCAAAQADVTTLAGSTTFGSANGTGSVAEFHDPAGVALDSAGDVYVADSANNEIREVTSAGVVTTLAGSTTAGSADGTGAAASFYDPQGIAVNSAGDIFVADSGNNEIRMITPAGVVSTLAGSTTAGSANGTGSAAAFNDPTGVAVDAAGDIIVADTDNNEIRMVTPAGVVSTLAGSTTAGSANGTGSAASFYHPTGVAVDASGNIYVADYGNNEIREITPAGVVTTLAGSTTQGDANGTGSAASFFGPIGVAVDGSGMIYVTDSLNNEIRAVSAAGVVSTLAGSPVAGSANGTGSAASFDTPFGIAVVQASGVLYVGDFGNNQIRQITPGP
jgi:serine/threonine-protein kinase